MRQILRVMVAILAVAALTGGGTVAFADRGPGGGGGSGSGSSGEEHGGHHEAGDDNGDRHEAGDDDGAKPRGRRGPPRRRGPGKAEDGDAQPADVYTLAEPQHGNPEGVAFDKRSGFFFVSATGDGSIYRGKLGDTATPVPVFIPGAAGQSATGLKVQHGKLYAAGASHGDDQGLRRRQRRAAGDVRHQGRRQLADLRQRPRRHQARRRLRDRLQAPRDLPPDARRRSPPARRRPSRSTPADVISTSPEIPFNAAPAAFNLNGIVVDDDRGDDEGRHHGDRHRHHGDRRADKLIVVDSDTGPALPRQGRQGRQRRAQDPRAAGRGRPVHGRRRPAHRSRAAARRAGLEPGRRLPQRGRRLHRPAPRRSRRAGSPTSAPTTPSRGRRPSRAPAIATWWSIPTSPPARRRSR